MSLRGDSLRSDFEGPAAATAKSLQSCPTLSLGFSREEHWSGLPFPSPMHEREK